MDFEGAGFRSRLGGVVSGFPGCWRVFIGYQGWVLDREMGGISLMLGNALLGHMETDQS